MISAVSIQELGDEWISFRFMVKFNSRVMSNDELDRWLASKFARKGTVRFVKIAGAILFTDKNIAAECYLRFSGGT